jgi:hypothetical protein
VVEQVHQELGHRQRLDLHRVRAAMAADRDHAALGASGGH